MLFDGTRCHRKTVLDSQYSFVHLAKFDIEEVPIYKLNHKSRVIDSISKVVASGIFFEYHSVVPFYGECLTPQEHIKRYQHADRCGPQEFGFIIHPNHIIHMDFAMVSNSFEFIKPNDNGNCNLDYDETKNELWLKPLRTTYSNDEITVNLNHAKTTVHLIKPATLDNSYLLKLLLIVVYPVNF
jgi:hypothetical protein